MIFEPLELSGAYLIKPEKHEDERGYFARCFCEQEFRDQGLIDKYVQCNTSYNRHKGTLRGLHFQQAPYEETKLVRCTQGAIYDVLVDLRPNSAHYLQWLGCELSSENDFSLYIPAGFAHGFMTLTDNASIFYQMSEFYSADNSAGYHWQDPDLAINWPMRNPLVSERDAALPFVNTSRHET